MHPDPLTRRLAEAEADLGGTLSVAARALDGSWRVRYRDAEAGPAASTIKVMLLVALLERVAAGEARLEDERLLGADDAVPGTGVLKALRPGRAYTLGDLATLMIIVSDNTATNLLIDVVGLDAVADTCARHGWTSTRLTGKLQTGRPPSTTSARDLADAFARLWRGDLLPEPETAFARGVFERQQGSALGRDLPYDPYSTEIGEDDLVVAAKNGAIRGVRNDAGVIRRGDGGFALAILTRDVPDLRFHDDNPGLRCIARVARLLYRHHLGA